MITSAAILNVAVTLAIVLLPNIIVFCAALIVKGRILFILFSVSLGFALDSIFALYVFRHNVPVTYSLILLAW